MEKEKNMKRICDDYYHRLCFYAVKYVKDIEEAKDIVQEVLVKIWERKIPFSNELALSAYLYSSVYHSCIDRLTLQGIHNRHHHQIQKNNCDIDSMNYLNERIENEILWEIFEAVEQLPEECKKVFKLSYIEKLDIAQVARLLNISEHTVKSQRARGKKLLQEYLKDLFSIASIIFSPLV